VLWPSGLVLARLSTAPPFAAPPLLLVSRCDPILRFIEAHPSLFAGQRCLELGSGCALASIVGALVWRAFWLRPVPHALF
jgi:hypothetical protein